MVSRCEVCQQGDGVISERVPGVAGWVQFCRRCVETTAIPLTYAVELTARIGGMSNADSGWYTTVHDTLGIVGMSCEDFDLMVDRVLADRP